MRGDTLIYFLLRIFLLDKLSEQLVHAGAGKSWRHAAEQYLRRQWPAIQPTVQNYAEYSDDKRYVPINLIGRYEIFHYVADTKADA